MPVKKPQFFKVPMSYITVSATSHDLVIADPGAEIPSPAGHWRMLLSSAVDKADGDYNRARGNPPSYGFTTHIGECGKERQCRVKLPNDLNDGFYASRVNSVNICCIECLKELMSPDEFGIVSQLNRKWAFAQSWMRMHHKEQCSSEDLGLM